jgi:hypothetical protein
MPFANEEIVASGLDNETVDIPDLTHEEIG